mmetsp:Transcript_14351/g.28331  ORF Transcript_14351/g.28331 Transcript_14351/m.28331 type:complete len:716 (+) Transcript_14351:183-2330(+)
MRPDPPNAAFHKRPIKRVSKPNRLKLVVVGHLLVLLRATAALPAAALVQLGHDGVDSLLNLLLLLLKLVLVAVLVLVDPLRHLLDEVLERLLVVVRQLILDLVLIVDRVLDVVHVALKRVLGVDLLLKLAVLLLKLLGLVDHALDLLLRQPALVVGDGDLLRLARALVLGADLEDTVGIDLEGHLDLGHAAGGGGDAVELELAEEVVVLGHLALALIHLDEHTGLVVGVGREDLRLLAGDGGVALDELGHDTASSLDTEREGGHVEEEEVLGLLRVDTGEDGSLHGGAVGHGLVGVDRLVELLAVEEVLEELLHLGDTGGPADEHKLVHLVLLQGRVVENALDGAERLLEEVHAELLELGAGDGLREVGAVEEGLDLDALLVGVGEGALGALDLAAELLHSLLVLGGVLARLLLEELEHVVHDAAVKVLATEMRVAVGGDDLEHTVVDGEHRHIEGASAKVEDEDVLLAALVVQTVGDGRGRGLVDDAEHVEARDGAGVLGRLALGVVEVGGYGNDGVDDVLAEEGLGRLLHLGEDHGRHLLRGVDLLLALEHDGHVGLALLLDDVVGEELLVVLHRGVAVLAADQALDVKHSVLWVDGTLVLGGIADEALVVGEGNPRGGDAVSLVVGDDLDLAVLVDTNAGIRGAQVDTDGGVDRLLVRRRGAAHEEQRRADGQQGERKSPRHACAKSAKRGCSPDPSRPTKHKLPPNLEAGR